MSGVHLPNAFSKRGVMNSNLDVKLDHSLILKFPYVYCSKCLFENLTQYKGQRFTFCDQQGNFFGHRSLI